MRSRSMTQLAFVESALKEWRKLAAPIREQFKAVARTPAATARVPSARLHNMPGLSQDQVAHSRLSTCLSGR